MANKNEKCTWEFTGEWADDDGHYDTSCGEAYTTSEGDRKANCIHFCPFCGGEIEESENPEVNGAIVDSRQASVLPVLLEPREPCAEGEKNIKCKHCGKDSYPAREFPEGMLYYCLSCNKGTLIKEGEDKCLECGDCPRPCEEG